MNGYNVGSYVLYDGGFTTNHIQLSDAITNYRRVGFILSNTPTNPETYNPSFDKEAIDYIKSNSKNIRVIGWDTYYRDYSISADGKTLNSLNGDQLGTIKIIGYGKLA